ncbi:MAG: radical SAM protein [Deltaproteobacteria bacterium]|nr:MAG: radical SAM protein [Deltaproteobacteria bacterium]
MRGGAPPGFSPSATQVTELGLAEGATPWIGPGGRIMERLELHLTYFCGERCLFCSEAHRMQRFHRFPVTWGRVARVLRMHAARGIRAVHFTGGEPTIHPRFVEVLMLARKLGMRTSIGTIGTMLAREDFARRALPHLDEVLFSVHGPDAAVHDRMAGKAGSFERVSAAMAHARRMAPHLRRFANTVITRHNLDHLPDTVAMLAERGVELVVVSNLTAEGGGHDRYAELAPRLEHLAEVLPRVPARAPGVVIRFFGVPMCLLGDHWTCSNDLHWDPRVTVEWQAAPGKVAFTGIYSWAPDRKRVHAPECAGCARRDVCMGINDAYLDHWSTAALRPFDSGT